MSQSYVLVFIKLNGCSHCVTLDEQWTDIQKAVKKKFPNIDFYKVTNNGEGINPNSAPKGLNKFTKWAPMLILIPKSKWNIAMANLGPNNENDLTQGSFVLNGKWTNGSLNYHTKYNRDSDGIVNWINSVQ